MKSNLPSRLWVPPFLDILSNLGDPREIAVNTGILLRGLKQFITFTVHITSLKGTVKFS